MKFEIGDREYEFDGEYTLAETMLFFDKASIGIAELSRELMRGNPYVIVTLMYILKKRAGEAVRWQDMQDYSISDFRQVLDDTVDTEGDGDGGAGDDDTAGNGPDPTAEPGTTHETATASTS